MKQKGIGKPLYPNPPMKHDIELPEADFFQVYLRGHLIDHHFPQRNNKNFIETRSDDAYDTFVTARLEGKPVPIARELAMRTLLAGLYVSRYDIILQSLTHPQMVMFTLLFMLSIREKPIVSIT